MSQFKNTRQLLTVERKTAVQEAKHAHRTMLASGLTYIYEVIFQPQCVLVRRRLVRDCKMCVGGN